MKSFTVLASAVLLALSLPTTYASPAEIRSSSGHQCTTYSRLLREENCAAVLRNGGGERKQRCLNIKDKRDFGCKNCEESRFRYQEASCDQCIKGPCESTCNEFRNRIEIYC
ncbi:hypothetical protein CIRG_03657 [Coccidioides immitis RMSCC 2394]|uniref:TNFR-Cys domain-containing protein n=1 Tax=Coccidioides immitis RMSCC 2394 TaxID=404692 RepID=A0A0J6Y8B8_COCIT|nr:hypothetical protein CIRG_03657 [Coccidioides immitis RMSCC 2394]